MDRASSEGVINDGTRSPDDAVFMFATEQDEPDIRRLLRENATDGWIRLSLEREPDALVAASVMGRRHALLLVRDKQTGEPLAMGEWSARDAFVDGNLRLLPYLSALRIAGSPIYTAWLKTGLRHILQLQAGQSGMTPFALTAIATDNHAALRILGANRSGMPTYRLLEAFSTFALRPVHTRHEGVRVEPAVAGDLPSIAEHLQRTYRGFQFAPKWSADDLTDEERCRGLRIKDFLVVRSDSAVVACMALWDQSSFKQTRVRGYAPWVSRVRPAINVLAPLLRIPRLPADGTLLRQVFLSHLAVDQNDPWLFRTLINAGLTEARRRGFAVALTGLASRHPLAVVLKNHYRSFEYRTLLHLVHYENGRSAAEELQPRLPHVEIAVL